MDTLFLVLAVSLGGTVMVMTVVIWSVRRHRDPILQIECSSPIAELMPSLSGLTLGAASGGNSVEVFENGAFFDVLLHRIAAAQSSVHFETFLWKDGMLAWRISYALADAARAGREVRVLLDATGAKKLGPETRSRMEDAGCSVAFFHRRRLRNVGVLNDRDHRKIVVIDGREAFVGGHCITDNWLGDAQDSKHFADVSLWLKGPIVNSIQAAFSENWVGETGELFVGDHVFPTLDAEGDVIVHAAYVKPERSAPTVKILHYTAICLAQKRLWIQNPYFIPDPPAITAFEQAVARGVDVRIMTPSPGGSDFPMAQHAGHRNFEKLLRKGVRLFEFSETLLHQKVMTVDGIWSAVGSSNFDSRSFETNDEIMLGIADRATAHSLDGIFQKYASRAREIDVDTWQRRGLVHRLKDSACYAFKELL